MEGARFDWGRHTPSGELRVAPPSWVTEMANGHDSPKYRLIRALNLHGTKLSGTQARKLLEREHLTNLHILNLSGLKLNVSFWRAFRTMESVRHLHTLTFGRDQKGISHGFSGDHILEDLRRIDATGSRGFFKDHAWIEDLFTASISDGVEEVRVLGHVAERVLDVIAQGHLPNLHRLVIILHDLEEHRVFDPDMEHEALGMIEEVEHIYR